MHDPHAWQIINQPTGGQRYAFVCPVSADWWNDDPAAVLQITLDRAQPFLAAQYPILETGQLVPLHWRVRRPPWIEIEEGRLENAVTIEVYFEHHTY